jgi:hypothetical protein
LIVSPEQAKREAQEKKAAKSKKEPK